MNYAYEPMSGLVHINFDIPLPHNQEIADESFFGRQFRILDDHWVDLWCTIEEWDAYLEKSIIGSAAAGSMVAAQWAAYERLAFHQWCAVARQSPFFKPATSGVQA